MQCLCNSHYEDRIQGGLIRQLELAEEGRIISRQRINFNMQPFDLPGPLTYERAKSQSRFHDPPLKNASASIAEHVYVCACVLEMGIVESVM